MIQSNASDRPVFNPKRHPFLQTIMHMHDNFIAGQWLAGPEHQTLMNPSDLDEHVGDYALADAAQMGLAIDAAAQAAPAWAASGIQARCDALDGIGTELLARREELGTLLSREEGKTLLEGIGELTRAGHIFKFQAQQVLRAGGETLPSVRQGITVETTQEPLGVVGLITPWNFPMAIPAWKIAPALAAGNAVVFKPAEAAPASAWALADIIQRSGVPAGAFNLVMGRGAVVGASLLNDARVAAISFTGSQATGRRVAAACAERMARCQVEMGGKNPLVVLDDADLDLAVECAVQGGFYSTGQRCTASSRLIVTAGIYVRFRDALLQRTQALRVGHALAADTQIGPVVDERQLAQDLRYIARGTSEGATLLCGGQLLMRTTRGHFLAPALFGDADERMTIAQEEIFGPVVALILARDAEQALALANDTPFGLSAGVCTTSLKHARHFQQNLRAGMVMVNAPTAGVDYHVPFGGMRASSLGLREQGPQALAFYRQVKTSYVRA